MQAGSPITPFRSTVGPRRGARRTRLARRLVPLLLLACASFAGGAVVGGRAPSVERAVAERFVAAWERGDHAVMHALLDPAVRRGMSLRRFARAYRRAGTIATLERVEAPPGVRRVGEGVFEARVVARTRLFGVLRGSVALRVRGRDDGAGILWRPHLVFPGLAPGERLRRDVEMPPRGDLLARDGTGLAVGEERSSELGALAAEVVGRVGPIPSDRAEEYEARGYPPDALVGLTGLEREFENRLRGAPGGTLRAGRRVLARARPRRAHAVRTAIDTRVQRAAVEALAGRLGGIAVLRPRTGEVLALAGLAYSAPQPPGSTFKIVTLAGALEAGIAKPTSTYPVRTAARLEGVELENAHGEACGGTLANSFAHSCNSVFAPMGAELGARRLVAAAERFGFNQEPRFAGALPSTIPAADEIGDDLAVGSTAIGQGRVLVTPLHLAAMTAAIANRGSYVRPRLERGGRTRRTRATSRRVARLIDRYMRLVVASGTGRAAAIPGVTVAGKTGTAELRDTTPDEPGPGETPAERGEEDTTDTDAWFVGYAPARRPRVVVAVLLVGQGAGGDTAAPAARQVLQAALQR